MFVGMALLRSISLYHSTIALLRSTSLYHCSTIALLRSTLALLSIGRKEGNKNMYQPISYHTSKACGCQWGSLAAVHSLTTSHVRIRIRSQTVDLNAQFVAVSIVNHAMYQ